MKKYAQFPELSIAQLEQQKLGLEDRIKRIQMDLKCPLDMNLTEQAEELTHRNILSGLLRHEVEYLARIDAELMHRKLAV